jgi:hypothetical protein
MSDSIENKLRNISKSVKAPPIPTLLERVKDTKDDDIGPDGAWYPCGIRLSNNTQAIIYEWIVDGIYNKSPGMPVMGGNEGPGQVTTRDPVDPLWERGNPGWNPEDPNTWGDVFGPRGTAERFVRYLHCYDTGNNPWSTNCPGLTDADINRMVEELKQLLIARCGFLVQEGGACCSSDGDFGGFRCSEVGAPAECVGGIFHAGKTCAELGGDNCALAANLKMAQDKITTEKQIMDTVMSILKVK